MRLMAVEVSEEHVDSYYARTFFDTSGPDSINVLCTLFEGNLFWQDLFLPIAL